MFLKIVSWNKNVSWVTRPICSRKDFWVNARKLWPSNGGIKSRQNDVFAQFERGDDSTATKGCEVVFEGFLDTIDQTMFPQTAEDAADRTRTIGGAQGLPKPSIGPAGEKSLAA